MTRNSGDSRTRLVERPDLIERHGVARNLKLQAARPEIAGVMAVQGGELGLLGPRVYLPRGEFQRAHGVTHVGREAIERLAFEGPLGDLHIGLQQRI